MISIPDDAMLLAMLILVKNGVSTRSLSDEAKDTLASLHLALAVEGGEGWVYTLTPTGEIMLRLLKECL